MLSTNLLTIPHYLHRGDSIRTVSYFIFSIYKKQQQYFKEPQIAKTILEEKNKCGNLTLPNFQTYCKAAVINTGGIGTGWIDINEIE